MSADHCRRPPRGQTASPPAGGVLNALARSGLAGSVLTLTLFGAAAQGQTLSPAPLTDADPTLRESLEPQDPTLPSDPSRRPGIDQDDLDRAGQAPVANGRTQPNYGKPRPLPNPRLAYPGAPRPKKTALPRTEPYQTAPREIRRDYARPPDPLPPTPYAQPQQIPRPVKPKLEDDPYAPTGLPIGSLRLYPFVESSYGQDSNATRSAAAPRPSTFVRMDAGFRATSNWNAHEFRADVTGSYYKFFDVTNADRPEGLARFNLRLDATRDTKLDFELRGGITTQSPGSPEFNVQAVSRPAIFTMGATGGVTRNFGRLEATIAALVDRTTYEDGQLSNGGSINYSINDFSQYGLRGRLAYEIMPGVKPFVEVTGDTRQHDSTVDANGFQRNSTGLQLRAGSTFEITRTLTGEVAAGYLDRKYADTRLAELRGATFDAALIWTATPLTTVTLRAATTANETTLANASGYVSQRTSLEVSHALLRNLTLRGIATWQHDKYQGISLAQDTFSGTLRAEYALTRSIVVKGSFTHERLKSSVPGADYTANVYLLGLRLQR